MNHSKKLFHKFLRHLLILIRCGFVMNCYFTYVYARFIFIARTYICKFFIAMHPDLNDLLIIGKELHEKTQKTG